MTESIKYLNRTLDYGLVEHGTEATVMIGEIYTRLADELIRSDRPAELSALELEQYEILLEEQAFPFEEQAIALHELNVGRIKDDVYDAWVARSIDALRELMPSRYDKTELVESHVATLQ